MNIGEAAAAADVSTKMIRPSGRRLRPFGLRDGENTRNPEPPAASGL